MSKVVQLTRKHLAGSAKGRASDLEAEIRSALSNAREDPMLHNWPDSLVSYLNAPFDDDAEWLRAYKAQFPKWRDSLPWAEPKIARRLRREQKPVRALVDSLLEGATPEYVVKTLNERLRRVRLMPLLWLRSQLGVSVPLSGSPFVLKWCGPGRPLPEADEALVDLARLCDTGEWQSLRKCPQCRKYFFSYDRRRKTYCTQRCMWQATQRRFRSKEPDAARVQRLKRDRERYLRRTGREAGLAVSE
jgi:hypothetical protein